MREFNRHQVEVMTDNDQALQVIIELGVLEQLSEKLPPGRSVLYHKFTGHPTHWILVGRFHGFEKAEDNGYMIGTWPKSLYPSSVVDQYIDSYGAGPGVLKSVDLPLVKPNKN